MESNGVTKKTGGKNKSQYVEDFQWVIGAGDRARTGDVQLGKLILD
jgi:hypothetical protein